MYAPKQSPFMKTVWLIGWAGLILGSTLVPARGNVISISPDAFGPSAQTETFEGIVGIDLPINSQWDPSSNIAPGYQFRSGLTLATQTAANVANVLDFNAYGYVNPMPGHAFLGYSLGPDDGSIWGPPWGTVGGPPGGGPGTTLPSGTAILTLHNDRAIFGFDSPVAQVGSYFEAHMYAEVGLMGDLTLEAFDAEGQSLGSLTRYGDGVLHDNALDSWIGLATEDGRPLISSVVVTLPRTSSGSYGVAVMDNVMFEVPEPMSLFLLLPGALFLCRRR
jgi:hypothetical protein